MKALIRRILHDWEHYRGKNNGNIYTWTDPDGVHRVGFLCDCGELSGVQEVPDHIRRTIMRLHEEDDDASL